MRPPFCRRHFQMQFHRRKSYDLDSNFIESYPRDPIDNKPTLVQMMAWRTSRFIVKYCNDSGAQERCLEFPIALNFGKFFLRMPWCMSGSLNLRWQGKRSRHSRRMSNPRFYVSGKRPMLKSINQHPQRRNTQHDVRIWIKEPIRYVSDKKMIRLCSWT